MQTSHFPVATTSIIILNAVIFVIGILLGQQTQIIQNYGFIPNHIFNTYDYNNNIRQNPLTSLLQSSETKSSASPPDPLTRLFTSMFVHAGIAYIAFNLYALGYLGGYAERAIGIPRYVLVYFTSGIAAALFHGAIASYILRNGDVVLVGASGAISGVLGIAAVAGNKRAYEIYCSMYTLPRTREERLKIPICVRGTWDADIIDEIKPNDNDHIIIKRRDSAFQDTELRVWLQSVGINTLYSVV